MRGSQTLLACALLFAFLLFFGLPGIEIGLVVIWRFVRMVCGSIEIDQAIVVFGFAV